MNDSTAILGHIMLSWFYRILVEYLKKMYFIDDFDQVCLFYTPVHQEPQQFVVNSYLVKGSPFCHQQV